MKLAKRTYQVLVEADRRIGTNERAYTAYVPALGIATDGDTFEHALANAREAAEAYLESFAEDGLDVPTEPGSFVAAASISL